MVNQVLNFQSSKSYFSLSLAPSWDKRLNSNDVQIVKGFVMLRPSDISVLGGRVEKLASKWELTQVQCYLLCYHCTLI